MPDDADQLLALALARMPSYLRPVRTHEDILASARLARARAVKVRQELRGTRERSAAALRQAVKVREQMQAARRPPFALR